MIIFDLDYRETISETQKCWGGAFEASIFHEKRKEIFNDLMTLRLGLSRASISAMSNGATGASTNGSTMTDTMVNSSGGITTISQSSVSSSATDTIF